MQNAPAPSWVNVSIQTSGQCVGCKLASWESAASRFAGNGLAETKRVVGKVMAGFGDSGKNGLEAETGGWSASLCRFLISCIADLRSAILTSSRRDVRE